MRKVGSKFNEYVWVIFSLLSSLLLSLSTKPREHTSPSAIVRMKASGSQSYFPWYRPSSFYLNTPILTQIKTKQSIFLTASEKFSSFISFVRCWNQLLFCIAGKRTPLISHLMPVKLFLSWTYIFVKASPFSSTSSDVLGKNFACTFFESWQSSYGKINLK